MKRILARKSVNLTEKRKRICLGEFIKTAFGEADKIVVTVYENKIVMTKDK